MLGLTERQAEALRLIREHLAEHGRPPTVRELGAVLGIVSTNGVNDHLAALERKGFIRRDAEKARGIVVLNGNAPPIKQDASAAQRARVLLAELEMVPMSRSARRLLMALREELLDPVGGS